MRIDDQEASQPLPEVHVATQHRSRRALALQHRRMDEVDAESALRPDANDELAPVAFVVDDEPLVRQLVSAVLRHRGWSVIEAADGTIALTVAPETLNLLVTDYEMPAVTGVTLAERLRRRDGELSVLMVSGHPDVPRKMRNLRGPRTAFVRKPFPVEELVSTIGSITK
jgi:CheY-like chemotaxis protein